MRKWLAILVLVLVAIGAAVLVNVGQKGESRVEAWVGQELKRLVNARDRFVLDFESIDYQAPNRVVMSHMKLSLAGSEGQVGPLVSIGEGTIELAKLPRWGEPIELKSLILVDPTIRIESFIAASRRERKGKRGSDEKRSFSSILTLRRVEIQNGSISYDDGKGSPLSWNQLNALLSLETTDKQWHVVNVAIDQSPLMKADVVAELNIDSMIARNISVKAMLDLKDPAAVQFFTPPLQRMLSKFEVRGRAEVSVTGGFNLKQRDQTSFDATLTMANAHLSNDKYKLPIEHITAAAQMRGNLLTVDPVQVSTLGGLVTSSASVNLDGQREVTAQAILEDINLHDLLKTKSSSEESELAGLVDADVRVNSNLADLKNVGSNFSDGVKWGSGYVHLTQGRLVRLPVIEQIMYATRSVTSVFTGKGQNRETFEAQFQLIDKVLDVGGILYRGDGVGMRGKGRIGLNGELDLVVNAGPLERLQETLGAIGDAWGRFTDSLMGYSVTGTVKEPVVRPMLGSR